MNFYVLVKLIRVLNYMRLSISAVPGEAGVVKDVSDVCDRFHHRTDEVSLAYCGVLLCDWTLPHHVGQTWV